MPANKRRRLNGPKEVHIDPQINSALPDILGEIDTGIGLRQRLAATLESRITWALCLQEALTKDSKPSVSLSSFKDAAFDALDAIETPVRFLGQDVPVPERQLPLKVPRAPPRPKQPLVRNPNAKFAYIRSSNVPGLASVAPDQVPEAYLLRCSVCQRSNFSSLQGLLNHGRISHKLEWGTHDECIRACAVVEPGLDLGLGQEVGLGPTGVLPGLRSLFQMAVGASHPHTLYSANPPDLNAENSTQPTQTGYEGLQSILKPMERLDEGVHLTQTLGLHQDTPALAPFLGKEPIKRQIRVWDTGEPLDIDGFSDGDKRNPAGQGQNTIVRHPWRASHARRNDVVDLPVKASSLIPRPFSPLAPKPSDSIQDQTHSQEQSRFHFTVRVAIADRSLWIPPDQRVTGAESHTHKWMISVDSPSYARNLTTVLQRLKVKHIGSNGPELYATEPPFAIVGTASEPFLAQVDLIFNGIDYESGLPVTEQTTSIEHWVELEPLQSPNITLGDEQVVDIELDRLTVVGPTRPGHSPLPQRVLWDLMRGVLPNSEIKQPKVKDGIVTEQDAWDPILTRLLPQCPMTLKDVRGRVPNPPPVYKLVSTPQQFLRLIPGRRKAIEWGRSLALRDHYLQAISQLPALQRPPSLSTGDVFVWLSERGHFPRPRSNKIETPIQNKGEGDQKHQTSEVLERWCPICGIRSELHSTVKEEGDPTVPPLNNTGKYQLLVPATRLESSQKLCSIVPEDAHISRMPLLDVRQFSRRTWDPPPYTKVLRPSDLLVVIEPHFIMGVYNIVSQLKLSTFQTTSVEPPTLEDGALYPANMFGDRRIDIEAKLGPHALLGLLVKSFTKTLVAGGLDAARKDRAVVGEQKGRRKRKDNFVSMLTPAHILRGVIDRHHQRRRGLDLAVFESLSRIGTTVDMNSLETGLGTVGSNFGSGGGTMRGLGGLAERLNIKVEQA